MDKDKKYFSGLSNKCVWTADYIIDRINNYNKNKPFKQKSIFYTKKLQFCLFLCEIEHMLKYQNPMFEEDFYTGFSIPAIPQVYRSYMQCFDGDMHPIFRYKKTNYDFPEMAYLTMEKLKIIDQVFEKMIFIDNRTMVQSVQPFFDCINIFILPNQVIPKDTIYRYYLKHEKPTNVELEKYKEPSNYGTPTHKKILKNPNK